MDTVFVKKVHPNSSAYRAGLREGDRLLAVNGMHVAGTPYAHVVAVIQQTPKTLTLQVVPKNYDILQTVCVLLRMLRKSLPLMILFLSYSFSATQHIIQKQIHDNSLFMGVVVDL